MSFYWKKNPKTSGCSQRVISSSRNIQLYFWMNESLLTLSTHTVIINYIFEVEPQWRTDLLGPCCTCPTSSLLFLLWVFNTIKSFSSSVPSLSALPQSIKFRHKFISLATYIKMVLCCSVHTVQLFMDYWEHLFYNQIQSWKINTHIYKNVKKL